MTKMVKCLHKLKLLPAVLVLLAMGCAQRDLHVVPTPSIQEGDFQVSFKPTNLLDMEAADLMETKAALPDGSTVKVVVYRRAGASSDPSGDEIVTTNAYRVSSGALTACTVDAAGTYTGAGTEMKLKSGTYDFYAYMPAKQLTGNYQVTGIPHGYDLLVASSINKAINLSNKEVALEFTHACSKVQFDVRPVTGMELTQLTASRVEINKMATTGAVFSIGTGIPASLGDQTSVCTIGTFTDEGDGKSPSGNMIVLPKSSGDFDIEADITLDGTDDYTLKATVSDFAFAAHNHYKFKTTVGPQGANLYLSVKPWTDVEDEEGLGEDNWVLIGQWNNINWATGMGGSGNTGAGAGEYDPVEITDWTEVNWDPEELGGI